MKYQVQVKYTNPSHEHVSLRRRVESVTRLVEARNEQEALNRVANQQRALGFKIQEAIVLKPMIEGFDPSPSDIAAHLVGKHGKGKVTKDHVDAYEKDRDSNKGIDKEAVMKHVQKMSEDVESVDEAQKKLKPSYWKAEWRLGTQSEVDKNNKKIFDKLAKTDPVKAAAFHDNLMRMKKKDVKEEVEQTDEAVRVVDAERGLIRKSNVKIRPWSLSASDARDRLAQAAKERRKITGEPGVKGFNKDIGYAPIKHMDTGYVRAIKKEEVESVEEGVATAQKVMDRAKVVANTNPDPKKRFAASGLAQKAMLRTINPTGVNTGITRGGGNKTYRMVTGKVPPYQLTKKTGVSEEVVTEASKEGKDVMRSMRAGLKSMDLRHGVDSDKRDAGYKMSPAVKAAQAKSDALSKREKKPQAGTLAAVHKSMEREMLKKEAVEYIEEKLTAADPASKWISDFVGSDNPKFSGKTKKERINMALGAYYAAKKGKNEEVKFVSEEKVDGQTNNKNDTSAKKKKVVKDFNRKEVAAAEVKKDRKQGAVNKINLTPEMDQASVHGASNVKV